MQRGQALSLLWRTAESGEGSPMPPKQRAARPRPGWEKRSSSRDHWGGTELGAGQVYALPLAPYPTLNLVDEPVKGMQGPWGHRQSW